ncbi:MAG: hypothetical protein MAG794_01474 [Gammaproteobacteria bacterium]|nr:hypothetical protein [Gammaproteobacteria bacterium]
MRKAAHSIDEVAVLKPPDFSRFRLARVRFVCVPRARIELPAYKESTYKGSAFHGAFGRVLENASPSVFQYFYYPKPPDRLSGFQGRGALPKPFTLLPPLDEAVEYRPGERFACELTLFGHAASQLPVCVAAFETLGERYGLGANRGKFRLEAMESFDADGVAEPLTRPLVNAGACTLNARQIVMWGDKKLFAVCVSGTLSKRSMVFRGISEDPNNLRRWNPRAQNSIRCVR